MNQEELILTLKNTVSSVLGMSGDEITDATGSGVTPEWDSVTQLNIIIALEEAFSVSFEPEQMLEMNSVLKIRQALQEKGL